MQIKSVKAAFFSPTGTTEAAVRGIVRGLAASSVEIVDITLPEQRKQPLCTKGEDLLIVGVPVYMGRVPALINDWLNVIEAHNTPTVCVVVYGNRVFDDALLELRNILKDRGCIPFAGAAYIGEHSFSCPDAPTAQGRPNTEDLEHADAFGRQILEKLQSVTSSSELSEVSVPGNYPYGGATELWDVDFIAVDDACIQCGLCAKVCPAGAVDPEDSTAIEPKKCITCCACLKKCPQNARTMKPGPVQDARERLANLFREPKQPECFI